MRWLVRLYPRAWRERYGKEFAALLEEWPLRARDVADIVRTALEVRRAARERQRQGELPSHRMRERGMLVKGAIIGLLAGLTIAGVLVGGDLWPANGVAAGFQLYTLAQSRDVRLLPLGAGGRAGSAHTLTIGGFNADGSPPEVLQSDDGHTVVAVWTMLDQVRVYAAPSGKVRSSFQLPVGVQVDGLSPDGTRLFGSTTYAWYAMSTATGRVVARLSLDCCPPLVYDAARDRLYVLQASQSTSAITTVESPSGIARWTNVLPESLAPPGPPRLVAYDLASGRPVASLVLEGVTYGSWGEQSWTPSWALSPNGRQIAIYDARSDRLTVVDPQHMRIVRSERLSQPRSVVDRVAQWLGIEPQAALAKGEQRGADLQMRYSPNGRVLYVTGDAFTPQATARSDSIGVRAIDVARGEITGEALSSWPLLWTQPTPDGSALYAFSPFGDDTESQPLILRLNPATLQIESQQVVRLHTANPEYYLLAASVP